jgi:hypothetical protein
MTLKEWSQSVTDELKAAGFEVSDYQGFPIVPMQATHEERVRFLKFRTTAPSDRRIYAEGCLFIPAGSWEQSS